MLVLLILTASAEDVGREPRRAPLQQRLREVRARLRLTDEQIERIRPILRSSLEAQARVLQEHSIDLERRPGKDRRLGRDLDAVRQRRR